MMDLYTDASGGDWPDNWRRFCALGKAAAAITDVASQATQFAALTQGCVSGEARACDALSKEDEAKKAWLNKLDVPSWGAAARSPCYERVRGVHGWALACVGRT